MSREEEIKKFDELVAIAAQLRSPVYCPKKDKYVNTSDLKGEECVPCTEFVVRGGKCDPLA